MAPNPYDELWDQHQKYMEEMFGKDNVKPSPEGADGFMWIYTKKDEGLCIKVETTYEDASEEFHGTIAQYEDWINKQHNELEELENGKNE